MLLWSFFLAALTSPGYPSEILDTMHGRSKRSIYDGDSIHDDVHVGLLEHGQYSLTHSPISATSSVRPGYPHSPGMMTPGDASSGGHGHGHGGHGAEGIEGYERREREGGVVNMMTGDDCTDSTTLRNASVDVDDHTPLGITTQRFTVKRDGTMRYCQKCNFEKPDRTHHCSSCKRCVLKMDHHCPWLNNCVGHKNHKSFYETTFTQAHWVFLILAGIIFGLCLVPFAIHHTLLMRQNKTTIESFEKHKYRMGSTGEVLQSRMLNVFDIGAKKNFVQVLGPVWYLWFIPVRNSLGDGWSFPANEYGKNLLRSTQQDVYSGHSTLVSMPLISSSFHINSNHNNQSHAQQHPPQDFYASSHAASAADGTESSSGSSSHGHGHGSGGDGGGVGGVGGGQGFGGTSRRGSQGFYAMGGGGGGGSSARNGLPFRTNAASPAFSTTSSYSTSTTTSASDHHLHHHHYHHHHHHHHQPPEWPQSIENHDHDQHGHQEGPPQSQWGDSSDLDENAYHRRDSDSDLDDRPRFRPRTPRRKFYRRYQGYMYNNNNNPGAGLPDVASPSAARSRLGAGTRGSSEDDADDDDDGQDIEPEEYIYDSDEQATIRFTER
ncbi:hypothetical protein DFQ27_007588 [Actinomortierella ambigua]|uniref:Palmitoyltransferase n=1 Tax=Actinomortierella ambigua TaxID=1343610 RepID=A0A9P6UBL0_9FUNG|nr:hypothetical protein DFQ27_007588 [Actinomortierella ambigua]